MGHQFVHFFAPVSLHTHPAAYYGKLLFGLVFVFGVLGALQFAPRQARKGIIAFFTFLGGLYYAAEFFIPADPTTGENKLTHYQEPIANISAVIGTFAIGVGVFSLLQLHGRQIARRRGSWGNSIMLIVAFLAMSVFGLLHEYAPHSSVLGTRVTNSEVYEFLFTGGLSNLNAAMFSIISFYIASASYRAFRIRSLESSFLMIAALIVMLGAVSFGTVLTSWIPQTTHGTENFWANFRIERISQWLLMVVNGAAYRGILFGLTIGFLATSLRLWLSLERSAYFDKEL